MKRYLDQQTRADLSKKMVILTGPRQVGKTTLSQQLIAELDQSLYLNYDIPAHRTILLNQSWSKSAPLLVFDEIHKMPDWKGWLKGVVDDNNANQNRTQQILVTGSARMDTFRQAGKSLAGRYFKLRLHPISVREYVEQTGESADHALSHLLSRGGFPEPCLAPENMQADRWRSEYFSSLVREDVLEFSRIQEVNAMRVFAQTLRARVGSPLSIASIARDMAVSPKTLSSYLDILEALFIVFTVRPWHHNIARSTLKQPKVYFYDTGLVQGDEGIKFENLVACHLMKQTHWQQDSQGKSVDLHYLRTKDDAEVDFALSDTSAREPTLTHLIECKLSDTQPHAALVRFARDWPKARAVQVVQVECKEQDRSGIQILHAARWLQNLEV